VQALNTGHDGSLCTIHANGPAEALARLETLMLLAGTGLPAEVARRRSACRWIAWSTWPTARGARVIESVAEVTGGAPPRGSSSSGAPPGSLPPTGRLDVGGQKRRVAS